MIRGVEGASEALAGVRGDDAVEPGGFGGLVFAG